MINLQIQKNSVGNPSTIAACLVPNNLNPGSVNLPPGPAKDKAKARFSELTHAIHDGLRQSVGSRRLSANAQANQVLHEIQTFKVQGSFSS
jgi:hypothetical protein